MSPRPVPDGLSDFLGRARWFGGKGSSYAVTGIDVAAVLEGDPRLELWIVRVDEDSRTASYHVPVEVRDSPEARLAHALIGEDPQLWYYDALQDRELTHVWLELLAGKRSMDGVTTHLLDPTMLAGDVPAVGRVLTAEQSNTSLVYGNAVIVKVYRHAQAGTNPDVEVHAALALADSPHVARPIAWLEAESGVVAFAQEFLTGGVEGWDLAISSVRDLLREGDLYAEEVGGDFAGEAFRLGVTTAEVHAAMRETLPTSAWGPVELRERAERLAARFEAAALTAPALVPFTERVLAVYQELAALQEPVPIQRIHGDLHLGQTMRVSAGWKILDFEGEPNHPLEERRAADTPLRDVAAMLRSFDYAARYPLGDVPPDPQSTYRAAEWADRNRTAFCDGYAQAAGSDPRDQDVLLRAYEADKVVYEVIYESRMRPHWVSIPMSALERLAG
jgi:maltokinase